MCGVYRTHVRLGDDYEASRIFSNPPVIHRWHKVFHLTDAYFFYHFHKVLPKGNHALTAVDTAMRAVRAYRPLERVEGEKSPEVVLANFFEKAAAAETELPRGPLPIQRKGFELLVPRLMADYLESRDKITKVALLADSYLTNVLHPALIGRQALLKKQGLANMMIHYYAEIPASFVKAAEARDELFEEPKADSLANFLEAMEEAKKEPDYELWFSENPIHGSEMYLTAEGVEELREELEIEQLWRSSTALTAT